MSPIDKSQSFISMTSGISDKSARSMASNLSKSSKKMTSFAATIVNGLGQHQVVASKTGGDMSRQNSNEQKRGSAPDQKSSPPNVHLSHTLYSKHNTKTMLITQPTLYFSNFKCCQGSNEQKRKSMPDQKSSPRSDEEKPFSKQNSEKEDAGGLSRQGSNDNQKIKMKSEIIEKMSIK